MFKFFPFGILFFLMLCAPTLYVNIKIGIVIFILYCLFLKSFNSGFWIDSKLFYLFILNLLTSISFLLLAILNGYNSAVKLMSVYFIYPIIYFFFISTYRGDFIFKVIAKTLVFSGFVISLYSIILILYKIGIVPYFWEIDDLESRFGLYGATPEFSILPLSSLLFITPFTLTYLVKYKIKKDRLFYLFMWLSLILQIFLILVSGRRALQMVLILSFILNYSISFMNSSNAYRIIPMLFVFLVVVGLENYGHINLWDLILNIRDGFDFSRVSLGGTYERKMQFEDLINLWKKKPVFGYGLGANGGYIRSIDQPFAYELSYVWLLFSVGIVGFLVYFLSIFYVLISLIKFKGFSECSELINPVLLGTVCFLIGNATNPYLNKFDFIWVVFLPIFMLNKIIYDAKAIG